MIGLKKRIEIIERLAGRPGRLLVVAANSVDEAEFQIVVEKVDRRLTDKLLLVPRHGAEHPFVRIHEPGLKHLLDAIDGRSKPLVREAA